MNAKEKYEAIINSTMLSSVGLDFIRDKTLEVNRKGIAGDIVECGCWMGGSAGMIAHTLLENKDERIIRLFDSFNDPPEPTILDGEKLIKQSGGLKNTTGKLKPILGFYKKRRLSGPGNAKYVYNLLTKVIEYPKEKVKIYKGWFQDTLYPYSKRIDKIALLILDCDLYASIKICLEYLYDKLVPGGIIIIDDYYYYAGAKLAVDEFLKQRQLTPAIPKSGHIWWCK